MPRNLPYMKWYPADFEDDEDVKLMTLEEVGFYVRCMNHAWTNNGLPASIDMLARLFRLDLSKAQQLWSVVGKKFFLQDDRLFNRRQEVDRAIALEVSSKRAAIGKRGALAKHKQLPESKQLPEKNMAIAMDGDSNCQRFASSRAYSYSSDSVSVANSSNSTEAISSESTELSATFDKTSKSIYARHPATRRNLTPWQIEGNLRLILGAHHIRNDPEKISYLLGLDLRHRLLCESEEWQEQAGKYAKSLRNWLKPEDGLYDIEVAEFSANSQDLTLDQRAALQRPCYTGDSTAEYHEFMRSRIHHQRAS